MRWEGKRASPWKVKMFPRVTHTHTHTRHLWVASHGTVESCSVTSHHHPVEQRRQELGGRSEVVLLELGQLEGHTWGRGDAPVRGSTLTVPGRLSSSTRRHQL